MSFTLSELVQAVAEDCNMTKADAKHVVASTFDHIVKAANRGEKVSIHQFGTFKVNHRKERAGRSPKTGEAITIPARNVLDFKATPALRDL